MDYARFESCKYGKLMIMDVKTEMSKEDLVDAFIDFSSKEGNTETNLKNFEIENISNVLFSRICGYKFYIGKFSYGEWKNEGEYFVGGYFYLISERTDTGYKYVIIHQKYCEDDFDRFGVLILHKGFCDEYNSESEETVKKKTLLIPPSCFSEKEMLMNIDNISNISDVKKFVNTNI